MSGEERRMFLNQHLAVVEGGRGASTLRGDFSKALQILMALVGLILLIACANVANILLARSAARQRELAVRVAMGAGASRLFRQVLTESVLLATIGAAFGLLLAHWADAALLRLVAGGPNPVPLDVHLDSRILAFTLGVAVLSGILFGLAPALRAARIDLSSVLKGTSRSIASSGSQAGRVPVGKTLVVAQVALSLLLLVVAGLFLRSFQNLAAVQIGYDSDHLLLFGVSPLSSGFKGPRAAQLLKDIIERLDAVPGVRSASLMDNGLFGGGDSNSDIFVEGAKPKAVETPASRWDMVGANFRRSSDDSLGHSRGRKTDGCEFAADRSPNHESARFSIACDGPHYYQAFRSFWPTCDDPRVHRTLRNHVLCGLGPHQRVRHSHRAWRTTRERPLAHFA